MSNAHAQGYIKSILAARQNLDALMVNATVLFADLVGSTEFKRHHGEVDGLQKTALHNAVITDAIVSFNGVVVKYLGDGVLGVFKEENSAYHAVRAAVAALKGIEEANKLQGWTDFERAMSTKIGIDSGKIWEFTFPQATVEDPQGLTVDIASRLAGLASSQQVVCTARCYNEAVEQVNGNGTDGTFPVEVGTKTARIVKGMMKPIDLYAIVPEGGETGDIALSGHRRQLSTAMQAMLNEGLNALTAGESEKALEIFREILSDDPGNFEANYRSAELLLGKRPKIKIHQTKILEEVITHLSLAKQSRPESSRVWHLASWAYFKKFELLHHIDDLELAVKYAETALEKAEELMDIDGIVQTKTCLARKLLERSQWVEEKSASDLLDAAKLCESVSRIVPKIHGNAESEYLITHALVRLQQGETDFKGIEDMIIRAQESNPQNDKVPEALLLLHGAQQS